MPIGKLVIPGQEDAAPATPTAPSQGLGTLKIPGLQEEVTTGLQQAGLPAPTAEVAAEPQAPEAPTDVPSLAVVEQAEADEAAGIAVAAPIETSWWDDIVDYVTDTYKVATKGTEEQVGGGLSRKVIEKAAQIRQAIPEYDSQGNLIRVRKETEQEMLDRENWEQSERVRRSGADQAGGAAEVTGKIVGELMDPLSVVVGQAGLTKKGAERLLKIAAGGAAYEGSSAAMEQAIREGEVTDPLTVAGRAALGAAGGVAFDRAIALGGAISKKFGKQKAEAVTEQLADVIADGRSAGLNQGEATARALRELKIIKEVPTPANLIEPQPTANLSSVKVGPKAPVLQAAVPEVAMTPDGTLVRGAKKAVEGVDKILGALTTRIRQISPVVANKLRKFDFQAHQREASYNEGLVDFVEGLKHIPKAQRKQVNVALMNRDVEKVKEILAPYQNVKVGVPGARRQVNMLQATDSMRSTLERVHRDYLEAGFDIGYLDDFYPRIVKDYEGLARSMGRQPADSWTQQVKKFRNDNKRDMTPEEAADLWNKMFQGRKKPAVAGGVEGKVRTVENVTEDMLRFYEDPEAALLSYARHAAHGIEKSKFFGRHSARLGLNSNVEDSIGALLQAEHKAGNLKFSDFEDLRQLLQARFIGGEITPAKGITGTKNVFYTTTLGNPISALTQIQDLGLNAYMHGIGNSVVAAIKSLTGNQRISVRDLGLSEVAADMAETRGTAKILNSALKFSGFKWTDRLGKDSIINAAFRKASKQLAKPGSKGEEAFRKEWGPVFGDELEQLIQDIRDDSVTQNVKLMLWNRLADMQPISPSEMPEAYLTSPNGRIFYMLKTFTIKQLDLIRNQIYNRAKTDPVGAGKEMVKLAAAVSASGISVDALKDYVQGKPVNVDDWDDAVVGTLLKHVGLSDYLLEQKLAKGKIGEGLASMITPPLGAVEDVVRDLANFGQSFNTLKNVPLVGKLLYMHFAGGAEKAIERQKKEDRRKLRERMGKLNNLKLPD